MSDPAISTESGLGLAGLVQRVLAGDRQALAIRFAGQALNWGWVSDLAAQLGERLDQAGLGPSDSVGFAPRNRPEFAAALLGLIASSRNLVMVYAYQAPEAIARQVAELDLPAVVAAAEDWTGPMRAAALATGALGVALGADGAQLVEGTRFERRRRPPRPVENGLELLTSGTTGAPKLFPMPYGVVKRAMVDESTVRPTADEMAAHPIALHFFPFGNISGVYSYLPIALARLPVQMLEKFSIAAWIDHVRTQRPSSSSVPPAAFRMILNAAPAREDLSSLEFINTGAASLDPAVHREFRARYAIPVLQAYGATEFGGVVAAMTLEDLRVHGEAKLDSVGRALGSARLRVVDPDTGLEAPPGSEGVLEVLAPRMGPDWVRTTDLAAIDVDGFLFHRGRSDGVIVRGGFKISPEAVSTALAAHPAIAAAVVVGLPDERLGETPLAGYELRPGIAPPSYEDLDRHMRARLPATHVPVGYHQLNALPRTPSLKPDLAAARRILVSLAKGAERAR